MICIVEVCHKSIRSQQHKQWALHHVRNMVDATAAENVVWQGVKKGTLLAFFGGRLLSTFRVGFNANLSSFAPHLRFSNHVRLKREDGADELDRSCTPSETWQRVSIWSQLKREKIERKRWCSSTRLHLPEPNAEPASNSETLAKCSSDSIYLLQKSNLTPST